MKKFSDTPNPEAETFLSNFLAVEKNILQENQERIRQKNVAFDVTREHMASYFREFEPEVRPSYRDWGDRLPAAIRNQPLHIKGEAIYDEKAKMCLLRMGYFFGECLVREFSRLNWSVGDPDLANSGEPVVKGFPRGLECAPIHVCKNIIGRIDALDLSFQEFTKTLDSWRSKMQS